MSLVNLLLHLLAALGRALPGLALVGVSVPLLLNRASSLLPGLVGVGLLLAGVLLTFNGLAAAKPPRP